MTSTYEPLSLNVPEPGCRPGDTPDFSDFEIFGETLNSLTYSQINIMPPKVLGITRETLFYGHWDCTN